MSEIELTLRIIAAIAVIAGTIQVVVQFKVAKHADGNRAGLDRSLQISGLALAPLVLQA